MPTDLRSMLKDAAPADWEPLELGALVQEAHVRKRRRRIVESLVGVAAILILTFAGSSLIRGVALQEIGTADSPQNTKDTGDAPSVDESAPPPGSLPRSGGRGAPGGSEGSLKDSRSGGSLPAGTIPRGFEIAFNGRCGDSAGTGDICLMNAEGSDLRKLRAGPAWAPEWSPDAGLIAFQTDNGDIQLMNADGSGSRNLGARGSFPSWSPDGGRLAFNWACDAQFGGACVSPDGTQNDCGPECGIGVVAPDGTGVRRLGNGIWPDWGPDGRIIFTDGTPVGPCHYRSFGRGEDQLACTLPVWVMNADGSGRTRLPVDRAISPTWSHDGRRIAYYTTIDGVFIANSDGTGIAKVAPAGFQDPSWSPDGLWLALTRYDHGENPPSCAPGSGGGGGCFHNIFLRGIDGSAERRLTNSNNDLFPAFSPRR